MLNNLFVAWKTERSLFILKFLFLKIGGESFQWLVLAIGKSDYS